MSGVVGVIFGITYLMILLIPFIIIYVIIKAAKKENEKFAYKNYDENFEQLYSKISQATYNKEIEELRMQAKIENKKITIKITIVILISAILVSLASMGYAFAGVVELVYLLVILIYGIFKMKKNKQSAGTIYKKYYKEKIILELIKYFEDNVEYFPTEGIPSNVYKEAEFERYDRYYSDDFMKIKLKNNCNAEMAEIHTEYESTDSDGNTTYHTLFRGIFAKIDTPKQFTETFYLRKDRKISRRAINPKSSKIQLDSPEFEKYFDVYGSNKIIAMQLLTSDIMQMLVEFQNFTKIRYELSIKNSRLYLRYFTGAMFEAPRLNKEAIDKNTLYRYYKILDFTFNLTYKIMKIIEETEY